MKKLLLIILCFAMAAQLQSSELINNKSSGLCINRWWNNLAFTNAAKEIVAINNCFKKNYTSYLWGAISWETITDNVLDLELCELPGRLYKVDDNMLNKSFIDSNNAWIAKKKKAEHVSILKMLRKKNNSIPVKLVKYKSYASKSGLSENGSAQNSCHSSVAQNVAYGVLEQRLEAISETMEKTEKTWGETFQIIENLKKQLVPTSRGESSDTDISNNEESDSSTTSTSTTNSSASSSRSSSPTSVETGQQQQFKNIKIDSLAGIKEIENILSRQEVQIKEIQMLKNKCLRALNDAKITHPDVREKLGKLYQALFFQEEKLYLQDKKKLEDLDKEYKNDEKALKNAKSTSLNDIASRSAIRQYVDSMPNSKLKSFVPRLINKGDKILQSLLQNKMPDDNDKGREYYLNNIWCLIWRFYAHALEKGQGFQEGTFYLPTEHSEKIFKYLHGYVELVKDEKTSSPFSWIAGLSGNPYAYERISIHYNYEEQQQYGIDLCFDINKGAEQLLPEGKAHILFGKNFIKIENHGLASLSDSFGHGMEFVVAQGRKIAPTYFGFDDQDGYRKERVPHKALKQFKNLLIDIELYEREAESYYKGAQDHGIKDMYKIAMALKDQNKNDQNKVSKIDKFLDFLINTYDRKYIDQRTGNEVMLGDSLFTPSSSSQ